MLLKTAICEDNPTQAKNMRRLLSLWRELARRIREKDDEVVIIFVTGLPEYMSQGYDVRACHFLVKPVEEGKLLTVLDRALKELAKREEYLLLEEGAEAWKIPVSRILYRRQALSAATAPIWYIYPISAGLAGYRPFWITEPRSLSAEENGRKCIGHLWSIIRESWRTTACRAFDSTPLYPSDRLPVEARDEYVQRLRR